MRFKFLKKPIAVFTALSIVINIIMTPVNAASSSPNSSRSYTFNWTNIPANSSATGTVQLYMNAGDSMTFNATFTAGRQLSFLRVDSNGSAWGGACCTSSTGSINHTHTVSKPGLYRFHIKNHSNSTANASGTWSHQDNSVNY